MDFAWDVYEEASSITGFYLYQSKQSGNYTEAPVGNFSNTVTTGSIPKPSSYGRYYWVLTAYYIDTSVTPNLTTESDYSNEVSTVVKPKPPKLLSVIQTAWNVIKAPVTYIAGLISNRNLRITG